MFGLGPNNKEEIAKKIVNLLAEEGVKVGDIFHILTCVRNVADARIEQAIEAEREKIVQPVE